MNTRSKRSSAIGLGLAALVVIPAPDGSIDQPDRQHVTFCYAGISADVPVVVVTPASRTYVVPSEDRVFYVAADSTTVTV